MFYFPDTDAHMHLKSPRSQKCAANRDGKRSGGAANDPNIETFPHCFNQDRICRTMGSSNYNTPLSAFGNLITMNIQENIQ